MILLIIALLSSCAKLNFPKDAKFYSAQKPQDEDVKKKGINYVLGKEEKKPKSEPLNVKLDDLTGIEAKSLIEIQKKEKELHDKMLKQREETKKIDYSKAEEATTLIDIMSEEQKAREKKEKSTPNQESYNQESYYNQQSYNNDSYGYEKTVWGDDKGFFC